MFAALGFFQGEKAGVFLIEIKEKRNAFGFGFEIGFPSSGIREGWKKFLLRDIFC